MVKLKLLAITGNLPTSTYEIVVDGVVVGKCQLRYRASKSMAMPVGFESHIYYEIDVPYRKMGYAAEALRLLLEEARSIGLKKVIITMAADNLASRKVAEKCGAILVEEKVGSDGILYKKYAVNL